MFRRFYAPLLALALMALSAPVRAETALIEITAFHQAIAEAAAENEALAAFYRARNFEPIWAGSDAAAISRRNALLTAFAESPAQGIPADYYNPQAVMAALRAARTNEQEGAADVGLTRLYLEYAEDVGSGLIDPQSVTSMIKREVVRRSPDELLSGVLSDDPLGYLHSLPPSDPEYARLMQAAMALRQQIAAGGWGETVAGSRLDPGESGPQVVGLRNRLISMGYLPRTASSNYDAALTGAVMVFQEAHGIAADGVAGPATLEAINVGAEHRLQQVMVAMERQRWMNFDRSERHVWVNLPAFTARIVDHDEVTFETRTVIGSRASDRMTPEFSDVMERMVINPSWFIPRSIAVNEYLPAMRSNPGAYSYLQVVDSRGRVVNRATASFAGYTANSFPFSMRQPPGPGNALGEVKFLFPNRYNIYLHDTPSKSLFQRVVRAFSHGCIRLQDPRDFAYTLLARQTDDPVGFFQQRLRSRAETPVELEAPVPVHLVYFTAFTNVRGDLQFRDDIYGRDRAIWNALAAAGVEIGAVQS